MKLLRSLRIDPLRGVKIIDPTGDLIVEVGNMSLPSTREDGSRRYNDEETILWNITPESLKAIFSDEQLATAAPVMSNTASRQPACETNSSLMSRNHDATEEVAGHAGEQHESQPYYPIFRLLVSSTVLTKASPMFDKMLNGGFAEGQLPADPSEKRIIRLPEEDPWSILLLSYILHRRPKAYHQYSYHVLEDMATLYDMYDLSHSLRSWFHCQLKGRLPSDITDFDTAARNLPTDQVIETMKLAFMTHDDTMFAQPTAFCVYCECAKDIKYYTQGAFGTDSLADGLIERLEAMHAYYVHRIHSLGSQLLMDLANQWDTWRSHFPDPTPPGAQPFADVLVSCLCGCGHRDEPVCEGQAKIMGVLAASLAGISMLGSLEATPNSDFESGYSRIPAAYVKYLRAAVNVPDWKSRDYRCKNPVCCNCGRSIVFVVNHIDVLLKAVFDDLVRDGVCLRCVKENRPFRTGTGDDGCKAWRCNIHNIGKAE
ncbi:hypothetical protein H2200_004475 [Cladophialophora chaetospira]|uniref:BTB domain-containing protein n=1 Tax=Cladophialophora chaetospira TaxID=386627 RepID=A0AA38XD68_9EURO|nr:hypothetical protein H2200_004475 [Cladophialophora chaetospira]